MDLRDLRYLLAVAEEGTLARAAVRLRVSASPLSRQIRLIEARLGLPVFARQGRRLTLTEAGARLLDRAREVLAAADQLAEHVRTELGEPPTRLAVGCVDAAVHTGLLATGLRAAEHTYPGLRTTVTLGHSPELIDRLRAGELDVALVHTPPPAADPNLVRTLVLQDPVALVIPAGHPAAHAPRPAALDGQAWITDQRAPAGIERFRAAARDAGFTPDIRYQAADLAVRVNLAAAGLGIAMLPARAVPALVPPALPVTVAPVPWLPLRIQVYTVTTRRPPRVVPAFTAGLTALPSPALPKTSRPGTTQAPSDLTRTPDDDG
ncbi:DNA-binding transcriptional regulator, LysR family [Amycolatopsis australiensis]|uniref:DNA-binding transcriptional regulator, LysR family n=1 Tax=Amycolatopsis australiensis TaxID=546364 RepID=A0A1K1SQD0_9PSEU|nr:DNA-binding transcriptional regulator, LysR family [Amycolatopsis australiensis]